MTDEDTTLEAERSALVIAIQYGDIDTTPIPLAQLPLEISSKARNE